MLHDSGVIFLITNLRQMAQIGKRGWIFLITNLRQTAQIGKRGRIFLITNLRQMAQIGKQSHALTMINMNQHQTLVILRVYTVLINIGDKYDIEGDLHPIYDLHFRVLPNKESGGRPHLRLEDT